MSDTLRNMNNSASSDTNDIDLENVGLVELIDVGMLTKIQEAFSRITGLGTVVTDHLGNPILDSLRFPDYCKKHILANPKGAKQCRNCIRISAEQTMIDGTNKIYVCHAGLVEFATPIIANGRFVGCIVAGQIRLGEVDKELVKECAKEIGADENVLLEEIEKVPVYREKNFNNAHEFLVTVADVLSDMAFGRFMADQANKEVARAAKMKSDFLANMSHEIRTPMNAVIGMAELALREDLSQNARNYINQIKSSSHSLLTIINDILDFSKIESGKMELCLDEYEPLSTFNDVANIIQTRLQDKDVVLVLDIDPKFPSKLWGDAQRIRQILINILNNATKFTNHGQVKLSVNFSPINMAEEELETVEDVEVVEADTDFMITEADLEAIIASRNKKQSTINREYIASDYILTTVCVEDTGIGIKEADLGKIFNSFQQVDSKRNRNIEGTGLGLTICKRLLDMMGGLIWVESKYGVGSKFYFSVPQKVVDIEPAVKIKEPDKMVVIGLFKNTYLKNQFKKDITLLHLSNCIFSDTENLEQKLERLVLQAKTREVYLFIDEELFTSGVQLILKKFKSINIVLVMDFFTNEHYEELDVMVLKKPLSVFSISALLNKEDITILNAAKDTVELDFGFTAPDAHVLVVDDNPINLSVTEGLLEPLKMNIDCAISGEEALHKCESKSYDIVFMDYMMPEMDGVEATHLLRKLPGYDKVPVIALTANAIAGAKEMFLQEGFNDFVAKPIELKNITAKTQQWLPSEKIIPKTAGEETNIFKTKKLLVADLDTSYAIGILGNENLFWKILREYHKVINRKCDEIISHYQAQDWKKYTIEVHALKSASKQIGALVLSEKAAEMEQAGNEGNIALIEQKSAVMLEKYISYVEILEPFIKEHFKDENEAVPEENRPKMEISLLKEKLSAIKEAADNLDNDTMETICAELENYGFGDDQNKLLSNIKAAVENFDSDAVIAAVDEWESLL